MLDNSSICISFIGGKVEEIINKEVKITINSSINSTLGRTVMTSSSTLLVLLCIFILGGDAIRSFVFAMIFGVIIGTLATIYLAAPVAYITDSRRNAKKA